MAPLGTSRYLAHTAADGKIFHLRHLHSAFPTMRDPDQPKPNSKKDQPMTTPDYDNIDLRILRLLVILQDTRSLARTAAALGLSVSQASRLLAQARATFGNELFTRHGPEMIPTPDLTAILPRLHDLFRSHSALFSNESEPNLLESSETIRIGAVDNTALVYVIKTLDQGAVCLNIDASKSGQTLSAEELAKQEASDKFGDITGVGAGRNWAHVNSVDYDPSDDSIIISSRHQSACVKIGRDKKVKWILAAPDGWNKELAAKVLKPIDKNGKPIKCEDGKCEGDFDWTWTQHTAFRIDSKSDENTVILSVFDNGDGRGLEQPPIPSMKYTRGVIYKINQKNMTVQQLWEVGKELGNEYFSPVTGITQYQADKNSMVVFYSTAGLLGPSAGKDASREESSHPYLCEYRWGETKPAVELQFNKLFGYQAMPISVEKAFTH